MKYKMDDVIYYSNILKPLRLQKYSRYYTLIDDYIKKNNIINGELLECSLRAHMRIYNRFFEYNLYDINPYLHALNIANMLAQNGLDVVLKVFAGYKRCIIYNRPYSHPMIIIKKRVGNMNLWTYIYGTLMNMAELEFWPIVKYYEQKLSFTAKIPPNITKHTTLDLSVCDALDKTKYLAVSGVAHFLLNNIYYKRNKFIYRFVTSIPFDDIINTIKHDSHEIIPFHNYNITWLNQLILHVNSDIDVIFYDVLQYVPLRIYKTTNTKIQIADPHVNLYFCITCNEHEYWKYFKDMPMDISCGSVDQYIGQYNNKVMEASTEIIKRYIPMDHYKKFNKYQLFN